MTTASLSTYQFTLHMSKNCVHHSYRERFHHVVNDPEGVPRSECLSSNDMQTRLG